MRSLVEPGPDKVVQLSREDSALLARRRRGRNLAMLFVLIGVAVLFYAIAMVKMATPGFAP
jgi:hypothetical protein